MNYGMHPGWIEVISGVMFSGKSEELIRRVRRATIARRKVQVFKSHLDARYAGLYSVSSHDGREFEASPVDSAAEIFRLVRPDTEIIAIDEAQFLDSQILNVATGLAGRGVRVILAGTDTDFRGNHSAPWVS
jgi:thymidine kinase